MFDNAGKKLKVLAKVLFVVSIVGGIGGGIASMIAVGGIEGFGILIGSIAAGIIGGWISSLPLYALGEIHENCEYTVREIDVLNNKLSALSENKNDSSADGKATKNSAAESSSFNYKKNTTAANKNAGGSSTLYSKNEPTIKCPFCGEENPVHKVYCNKCGKSLSK